MKTLIYAHPYDGSLNHAILNRLRDQFDSQNEAYQIIDLYADHFNPAYTKEELRLFSRGESVDPLVKKYQEMILASDELIFIFPIWWFYLPAIVKGFLDKVMLKNFAYEEPWRGLLANIQRTTVISTATVTKDYLTTEAGDPIQGVLINRVFADLGIDPKTTRWIHLGEANVTTDAVRNKFLRELPELYAGKDSTDEK
ncbi:NAD(P)H-dependent oxidoreductase [Levilactobacillus bambusae]|uniref:Flavodoxin n=1 Tax=Levilactobacillus bambusae TaxID=2024736 RepID=A0A2V1N017_9LACO|nr:NAD(P)H-dependent oxidoreductase [Levilactobacillus bambusae]PWG00412.1 flavodoxin [Levilactobacillus bambusae]